MFGLSLQTYGAEVDQLRAEFGGTVDVAQVEQALRSKKYKIVTITHVDTSTGVDVSFRFVSVSMSDITTSTTSIFFSL